MRTVLADSDLTHLFTPLVEATVPIATGQHIAYLGQNGTKRLTDPVRYGMQIHNLEKIIERQEYCLFEHEHSIYLTEATAQQMCQMEGFEIINFNLVPEKDRRANSLIFVATPKESRLAVHAVRPRTSMSFSNLNFYKDVGDRISQGIVNLETFVDRVTGQGKKLAGYGAGGRGVMTLAAMNNANKLRYLVDKKPKRAGLLVPKSGIPLVNIDYLRSDPVDEILVFI